MFQHPSPPECSYTALPSSPLRQFGSVSVRENFLLCPVGMATPRASRRTYGVGLPIGRRPCEIAAIKEANSASERGATWGVRPGPGPSASGAFSFVPAGLTAHIQYGARSTVATPVDGGHAPLPTGTKLKAPPVSDFPTGPSSV